MADINITAPKSLQDLLTSKIPVVYDAAHKAEKYLAEFQAHQLSQDEYNDLIDDIARLDTIDQNMTELETYREITIAFNIILELKSLTSLL